jgi:hypothetical protein
MRWNAAGRFAAQPGASLTLYGRENQDREALMAAAPLTRRPTVSVRFPGLTDRRARRSAHGGSDRPRDDSPGDGTGRGPLLDGLTAGDGSKGGRCDDKGDKGAFHGEILPIAELQRYRPLTGSGSLRQVNHAL